MSNNDNNNNSNRNNNSNNSNRNSNDVEEDDERMNEFKQNLQNQGNWPRAKLAAALVIKHNDNDCHSKAEAWLFAYNEFATRSHVVTKE